MLVLGVKFKKHPLSTRDNQVNRKTGLLEHQFHTRANTPANFQARIIGRIRCILKDRIEKGLGRCAESTVGYIDNVDALSREFGTDPVLGE